MIHRDIPVMLGSLDLFDTTKWFLELTRGNRVAFVNPHLPINDDMDFAIRVGTNRGADYRLFRETNTAEKWLVAV